MKEVNRVVQLFNNPPERAIIALCPEMHCHAKQRVESDRVECSGGEKLYVHLENNCMQFSRQNELQWRREVKNND